MRHRARPGAVGHYGQAAKPLRHAARREGVQGHHGSVVLSEHDPASGTTMSEDAGARRPSIATIFNPRRGRGSTPSRPSVVVTDEDSPGPPLQLSNGSGMRVGTAGISGRCGTPGGSLSITQGSPVPHPDADSGEC